MHRPEYDLAVVGSGFGGSVCALRAAEAGLRVVLLERGREMTADTFENLERRWAGLFHRPGEPGLIELHCRRSLLAVTASAVGGGSHIYTGVTLPAPPEAFNGWPEPLDGTYFEPYYRRVEEVIRPSPIPTPLARTIALEEIGGRLGAPVTRLPLAMDWPEDPRTMTCSPPRHGPRRELVSWLHGGPAARKRTLDATYLQQARHNGVEVRGTHEVTLLEPTDRGYRVHFRCRKSKQVARGCLQSRRVILAAGTLNTVRLLLMWRDLSRTLPRVSRSLGQRFFTNGDFGGLLVGPQMDLSPDSGPPVTSWIDLWAEDRLYVMETGLLPLKLKPLARGGRLWSLGVMGFDDNPGRLRLNDRGALTHCSDPRRAAPFHRRRLARLREVARASGGKLLAAPLFATQQMPVTIHPLGGAAVAQSPDHGVTDPFGEVFGYPGLYVADGSLVPTPLGVAPSMTIAALAEHVVEHLLQQC